MMLNFQFIWHVGMCSSIPFHHADLIQIQTHIISLKRKKKVMHIAHFRAPEVRVFFKISIATSDYQENLNSLQNMV
jgi:hypothetical protein